MSARKLKFLRDLTRKILQGEADASFYVSRGIARQRLQGSLSFDDTVAQSGQGVQNLRIHIHRLRGQSAQFAAHFALQVQQNLLGGFLSYSGHPGKGGVGADQGGVQGQCPRRNLA